MTSSDVNTITALYNLYNLYLKKNNLKLYLILIKLINFKVEPK